MNGPNFLLVLRLRLVLEPQSRHLSKPTSASSNTNQLKGAQNSNLNMGSPRELLAELALGEWRVSFPAKSITHFDILKQNLRGLISRHLLQNALNSIRMLGRRTFLPRNVQKLIDIEEKRPVTERLTSEQAIVQHRKLMMIVPFINLSSPQVRNSHHSKLHPRLEHAVDLIMQPARVVEQEQRPVAEEVRVIRNPLAYSLRTDIAIKWGAAECDLIWVWWVVPSRVPVTSYLT